MSTTTQTVTVANTAATTWKAQLILATTPAGPRVSRTTAAGSVARLRQAAQWARPYLAALTGLSEAAEKINDAEPLIVDRRGLLLAMNQSISRVVGEKYAPLNTLSRSIGLKTLSSHALGLWDPTQNRRILCAPSVLTLATRYDLDHRDFSRWAMLRTSLWATHFEYAPHLMDYLGELSRDMKNFGRDFAQLVILLSVLPDIELEKLSPKELPSINWIRQHRTGSAWVLGLSLLPAIRMTPAQLDAQVAYAKDFCRSVIDSGALEQLLSSVDNLPTTRELVSPQRWCERVGIRQ